MRARLKSLAQCSDAVALTAALRALCAEFGELTRIKVLTLAEAEKRRALCLLRLESQAQEQHMMTTLGVPRFGEDVLVVVDLESGSARSLL
jgi:hypothetical protein